MPKAENWKGSDACQASISSPLSIATVPGDNIFERVKNATRPARALAPWFSLAIPNATPTANNMPRLSRIAPPAEIKNAAIGELAPQSTGSIKYPKPRSKAAKGITATGCIRDWPNLCSFSFITTSS